MALDPLTVEQHAVYGTLEGDPESGDVPEWMDAMQIAALIEEPFDEVVVILDGLVEAGAVEERPGGTP